jgi:hypothetical protein
MYTTFLQEVEKLVLHSEAQDGYVDVLRGLAILMAANPNKPTQKAAKLVDSLATVLNEYLKDEETALGR